MLKKLLISAVAGAATMVAVTAAQAATTFDFTDGDRAQTTGNLSYTEDGLTLNASSAKWSGGTNVDSGRIGQRDNHGLFTNFGILDPNVIDGFRQDDIAVLSFDRDVYLEEVSFNHYDGTITIPLVGEVLIDPDKFAFFFDSDDDGDLELIDPALDGNPFGFTGGLLKAGDLFGIGAIGKFDNFYLASATVTAVPLPPAMALFGGAVLGLGWLARRRKNVA